MLANISKALVAIRESEGMDVNRDPGEPGGISKGGVSLTAYADYCNKTMRPAPTANTVANLTTADVDDFYTNAFLPRIRFNDLPSGVDYRLADIEVNSGQRGAIWIVELALGMWPITNLMTDGVLNEIKRTNPRELILQTGAVWIGQKHLSPKWMKNGHGWTNRRNKVDAQAIMMIGG